MFYIWHTRHFIFGVTSVILAQSASDYTRISYISLTGVKTDFHILPFYPLLVIKLQHCTNALLHAIR